jgi:uncharacterized protein (DUF952 family)
VLTFHLVAREVWEAQRARDVYVPEAFAADGFVHCTDGDDAVIDTANRYYRDDSRAYVVLTIAVDELSSEVKYEDAARIFPHVYGPIDIAAVREVRDVRRDPDGTFLPFT